jgi:uncharacterized protein YfaS (alpha-2-macroglobulin family)
LSGDYEKEISVAEEGEYEVVLKKTDGRGNEIRTTENFYVYGNGSAAVQPLNNESLDIAVDSAKVEVGDSVHMVIKSPFPKAKALISIERGTILSYQIVDVVGNFFEYTAPVTADMSPNFFVTAVLLSPVPALPNNISAQLEPYLNSGKLNDIASDNIRVN